MKILFFASIFFLALSCEAQELFTMTEPASNMASGGIAIRFDNSIMDRANSLKTDYHFIPEVTVGISKNVMLRGSTFF